MLQGYDEKAFRQPSAPERPTGSGHYTVEPWLEIYAEHAHAHAARILRARRAPTSAEAQ